MALIISDVTPRISYSVGSSTTGPFSFPFATFTESDLKVYVDGTLQELTTNYTVTGAGLSEGGSITMTSAIAGVTLVILRDIPIERTTDFPTAGPLVINALNTQLKKMIAIDQQLDARLDRTLRPPDSDGDVDMTLPAATSRQDKYLSFGASGEPVMADGPSVSTSSDTVFNSRSAAAAATIGASVEYFRLTGYASTGDGGAALYKRISTPSPVKAWHVQSADGAYWQLADPILNARALGAKGDNSTDNSSVLVSISDALDEGLWSRVYFPNGIYRFGTTWDLSSKDNFIIEGNGGRDLTHAGIGSALCFTGSGAGRGINVRDSRGWTFRDLALIYTSGTYTGALADISHTVSTWTKGRFDNVHWYQFGSATYGATLVYALDAVDVVYSGCRFSHATNGVVGAFNSESSAGSGVHTFIGCDFVYVNAPIANPGLDWAFLGCRFEPNSAGAPAGIIAGGSNEVLGLSLSGCSFSDCTEPGTWIDLGNWFGGSVNGCSFAGDINGSDTVNAIRATSIFGVAVTGNLFSALTNGIIPTGASQMIIAGNSFPNTTTPVANITNLSADSVVGGNNTSPALVWMPRASPYTVATVPAAASYTGGLILVSNESGGSVIAFSDGINWRRVTDRVIIS